MIALSEILADPELALDAVVVGDPDARVRWVATSELDDPSPFLEGGEILLTTGLTERDPEGWDLLVTRCRDAGVVAIGFGVGLSHPEAPPALRAAAERHRLTLFTVPRRIPFIAVSRAVAELLAEAENAGAREALRHQQTLTRAAASGTGGAQIVTVLSTIVDGEVILTDAGGQVLQESAARVRDRPLLAEALPLIVRLRTAQHRGSATSIAGDSRIAVHPVGTTERVDAYLVVETGAAPTSAQRSAITTAIALLALDRRRAQAEREAVRRLRAGACSLLLQGEVLAARALLGDTVPGSGAARSRSVVIRARGPVRAVESVLDDADEAVERLGDLLLTRSDPSESASDGAELAMIVDARHADDPELLSLLARLEAGIASPYPLDRITVGDTEAREALALATPVRPLVRWAEVAARGVDALVPPGALQRYSEETLSGVLARADRRELLDSVRAFLVNNGHQDPTARSLGIHRNTLAKRLGAAQDALGRSLQDPQTRADLWFALKQFDGRAAAVGGEDVSRAPRRAR